MINVFFPYYQCGNAARQAEIDLCLEKNAKNANISKLFVVIDDGCESPVAYKNVKIIHVESRLTYKYWVELTEKYCSSGISVLCNSDIYFDETVSKLADLLDQPKTFVALSRWELTFGGTSKHPDPHWSQDAWAMRVGEEFSSSYRHQLDFPMGVPRCDNKVAYLFAIQGWKIYNPLEEVKSIHVHKTQMRTYHKKLDDRILGGVAYVHPGKSLKEEAKLDFDVWTKRTENIQKVTVNKAMEKWIREAKEAEDNTSKTKATLVSLSKSKASDLIAAMRNGDVLDSTGVNFQCIKHDNMVFFSNTYAIDRRFFLDYNDYSVDRKFYNVAGLIPPVLSTYVKEVGVKPLSLGDLNFWQYPCATEKQAYQNHLDIQAGEHVDSTNKVVNLYVPVPWATYVDKNEFPEDYLLRMKNLVGLYKRLAEDNGFSLKVHSVCQHIHWIQVVEKAQWIGITDFYLSHKDSTSESKQREVGTNLKLHGWTLIAVNYETSDRSGGMERKPMHRRNLLASFIGAHMPHYRDDSRIKIFEAAKACGRNDVFVDLGDEWHFNRIVYEEQVLNTEIESFHIDELHKRTFRYNRILSDSRFSLCPQGAGPNTLRFWESIAVGSIPVVFSQDLGIFEELKSKNRIKDNLIIWTENIDEGLFEYLAEFEESKAKKISSNLIELYESTRTKVAF